jgi:hypothetical protein
MFTAGQRDAQGAAVLEPDRNQIEIFVDAIFRHAAPEGFVSVRVSRGKG